MEKKASRNWIFTLNNPVAQLNLNDQDNIKYAVWQGEIGNNEGTYHYQGYIELKTARKLSYMTTMIPRAHFQIRRGTDVQARDYAMKENTRAIGDNGPWEVGVFVAAKPGKRSDLEGIRDQIDSGASEMEIAENNFGTWCKYYKSFERYRNLKEAEAELDVPKVTVVVGPTGTGKTLMCTERGRCFFFDNQNQWWDGYRKGDIIVFDDFYGGVPFNQMLRILDRYPYQGNVKGGRVWRNSKEIYITSNARPDQWYKKAGLDWNAFARRVHRWIYLGQTIARVADNWSDFTRILAGETYFDTTMLDV